jgi:hypothetical protein
MNDEGIILSTVLTLYSVKRLAFYGTRSITTDVYCNVQNVATWQCHKHVEVRVLRHDKFTVLMCITIGSVVITYLNEAVNETDARACSRKKNLKKRIQTASEISFRKYCIQSSTWNLFVTPPLCRLFWGLWFAVWWIMLKLSGRILASWNY